MVNTALSTHFHAMKCFFPELYETFSLGRFIQGHLFEIRDTEGGRPKTHTELDQCTRKSDHSEMFMQRFNE